MASRQWSVGYFLKGHVPPDDGGTFACGVEGVGGVSDSTAWLWGIRPTGEVLAGTCGGVLDELSRLTSTGFRPDAAVVFFAKAPGMESFRRQAALLLPGVPFGGGCAAVSSDTGRGELLPAARDVSIFLIRDGRYRFANLWQNIHGDTGRKVCFRAGDARTIMAFREGDEDKLAQSWYRDNNRVFGFRTESFENLALASPEGWNLHASPDGKFALHTGADLPGGGELVVRAVDDETATERVAAFCSQTDLLVFGCAGLKSLLTGPLQPGKNTLVGFLHGEVLTAGGSARFTNLMMSGLKAELI